ncbi:CpaE-like family protein [Phytohabitans sp. ZYX-F-186]|uniref:CpaE-like family protein n=1 Tax=Phytohabitans maris TaxID=3071409 RepID=A0ABU0ZQ56_9ACTN|nr:septum site-determining protein Ssd [Phytohabitans sp. ZYX-F-186]MDQ7908360.1 CpaE-like family protein [Phytohabitans sp. ZYX-F-186]
MPLQSLPSARRLPLLVTADNDLLEDLLRLAAAGGCELEIAPDPAAARPRYPGAPMVLVGMDQAQAAVRAALPRRPRVVLVGRPSGYADDPWQVAEALGAEHVAMLPAAEGWLVERFAERLPSLGHGRVLGVVGGRGGAGASVLASGLAVTAKRAGLRTLLVDADPLGGGLDLVLGWEDLDGLRWPALSQADGRIDATALVGALPHRGGLVVLSWDRGEMVGLPPEAMAATMDAGRRACDLVVVDLPRQFDDAAVVALQASDRVFLVVPAEIRAAAAAARIAALTRLHCADVALIVRGPTPGRLRARDIADSLHMPLAGTLRPEPALSRSLEHGVAPTSKGRGPLAALCQRLVAELTGTSVEAAA